MTRLKNSGGKTTQHNGPYSFLAEADCRCLRGRTVIEDVGTPWERERFHEKRDQDVNEKSVEVCISADFFHMPVTSIIFPVRVFSAHPAWKGRSCIGW